MISNEPGPCGVEFIGRKFGSSLLLGQSERHVQIMCATRTDRRDVMNGQRADDRVTAADTLDFEVPDKLQAYPPGMTPGPLDRTRMSGDEESTVALGSRLVRNCIISCRHVAIMRIRRRH